MIALIIVSASVAVLLTSGSVPRRRGRGRHRPTALEEPFPQGERKWSVMERCASYSFRRTGLPGSAVAAPVRGATVLPLAAGLLRRLIRLIGGSR